MDEFAELVHALRLDLPGEWPLSVSNLHPHNFLICRNDLISNLHKELERQIRALGRENGRVHVFVFAGEEIFDALIRLNLEALHCIHGGL
ncbi:MAG TPA: hypothetical protein VN579_03135, partial [Bryobacteraceae bacterium]|nr:hypothetical protein [Bryobacteraceae bacterium]